jgi:multidrug efflux pump subunit AcrB
MQSLLRFFIRYPIWGNAIIVVLALFGYFSLGQMRSSFFPEIPRRQVIVQVAYPGASPEEIEEGVILKIEDKIRGVQGVDRFTSTSLENIGTITVEVLETYDSELVLEDVKNAVNSINSFPTGIENPVIFNVRTVDLAMDFVVTGEVDLRTLKQEARKIEDDLRLVDLISQVELSGFPAEEIVVALREKDLRAYNLNFQEVADAMRRANLDVTGGSIRTEQEEFLIRARSKAYYVPGLEDIVIKTTPDGQQIRLRQVANVTDTWAETPKRGYLNSKPAVRVRVSYTLDEDILKVTDYLRGFIEDYNQQHTETKIQILNDLSVNLRQRIDLLSRNGLIGAILVVLTLGLLLNVRLAFWVALGIPVSFLGMFVIINLMGITINVISLFGMIIVVGILVDDGIVVAESIFQEYEKGKSPYRAAMDGTMAVIGSVFAAIITTVAAFSSFFLLAGTLGEFLRDMAWVVIISLLVSLAEVIAVLPSHLAHSKALSPNNQEGRFRKFMDGLFDWVRDKLYSPTLRFSLNNPVFIIALAVAITMVTKAAKDASIIGGADFPYIDRDNIQIGLEMPAGTREEITLAALRRIEAAVAQADAEFTAQRTDGNRMVQLIYTELGTAGGFSSSTAFIGNGHLGNVDVKLLDGETRMLQSYVFANRVREILGGIPGAERLTFEQRTFFGKPVGLVLVSNNVKELEAARDEIKSRLKALAGLRDVVDNGSIGLRELHLELTDKARLLGLQEADILTQVRQAFFGLEVQRLQRGLDEVKIWVRYDEIDRSSTAQLDEMRIRLPGGVEYPLAELASYQVKRGPTSIKHLNGRREITIEADLSDPEGNSAPILSEVNDVIVPEVLARYPSIRLEYGGQQRQGRKFEESLPYAMGVSIGLMVLFIILGLRSFWQGLIVFLLVPFSLVGVAWGHYLNDMPINRLSLYGIIALAGIVVNDALVYMETFNANMRSGMKFREALFDAGYRRFRPILLTTITTVLGMAPLILEKSLQAQFLIPMAISVSYGLVYVTFIMLVLLPAMLIALNQFKRWLAGVWAWVNHLPPPAPEDVEHAAQESKFIENE